MLFWWKKKPPESPAPLVPAAPRQVSLPVTPQPVTFQVAPGDPSQWWVQGSDETVQRFSRDRRDEEVARQLALAMQSLERQSRTGQHGNKHQLQNYIHKLKQTLKRRQNRKQHRRNHNKHKQHQNRTIDVEFRRTR